MSKFFTADHHFNHASIIRHCTRPFADIYEMNPVMIRRWNEVVSKGDVVYHLGDFAWGQVKGYGIQGVEEIIDTLNGQIILIEGSHDKPAKKLAHKFVKIIPMLTITEQICGEKVTITLNHYAMRVWPRSHFGSWHLYGHSHGRLQPLGKSWDVGVDNNNFYPLSLYQIADIMKTRPDNFNMVHKEANDE